MFWFSEFLADCSFMWSLSLICNLNFTLFLSKITILFSFILVVIDGAFVTFRMFTKSNLKDPLN